MSEDNVEWLRKYATCRATGPDARLRACADELAELRKENERLKAERDAYGDSNVKLVNRLAVLESIRDRLLAWGETVALYVLEDMPKLGGIIAAAKASKEKET